MSEADLPLHVETHGMDPGPHVPTFVLLHGFGGSLFSWRTWTPALAERGHVVLVDLKGFGAAPRPDEDGYGPEDQAALIRRLILERDLRNVILVGHSLGGGVAIITALRLQDDGQGRVAGLVILAGAAYEQKLPPFVNLARWPRVCGFMLRMVGTRRVVRWILRSIVVDADAVDDNQVEGYARPLDSPEARRALWAAARAIVPANLDEWIRRYPTLDVPTLVLWGAQDRVVPLWVGERLAADLPDARLEVLDHCGHIPAEEHPAESLDRLLPFVDQVTRGIA